MVLRNLLRRRTRTLLTLIGITVSVAAVVALGAFADGFSRAFTTVLTSSGADLVVSQSNATDVLFSSIDSNVGPQLARLSGVSQVSGALATFVSMPGVPFFLVFGLDPKEFAIHQYWVVAGKPLAASHQILLGRSAANTYHKRVGDYFKLQEVSFQIVGLYETGQGLEDSGAVILLHDAQEIFKRPSQVGYYQLKLKDPGLTAHVIADVGQRFPDLAASRSNKYADNLREIQMLRAIGFGLTVLAILAGGLGMMNTMLMSVFERTREIGMLRAVGWRRRRVAALVVLESLLVSVPGGLTGIVVGMLLTRLMSLEPSVGAYLTGAFSPSLLAEALLLALLVGAAGAIYPAWQAANRSPIEALRYE